MNAGLANTEPARVNLVLHRIESLRDRLARSEIFEAPLIGRNAAFVDAHLLIFRLAEAIGALHVSKVAAELRVHLADDQIAALDRPRGRNAKRMRVGIAVAVP